MKLDWLTAVAILAVAAMPPAPPVKVRHKAVDTRKGAQLLITKAAPAKPNAVLPMGKTLRWNWTTNIDNPWSQVVFLIKSNSVPVASSRNWPVVATTTTNSWPFTVIKSNSSAFFDVAASNKVTHLVNQ